MPNYVTSDAELLGIANKIREKLNSDKLLIYPDGFIEAIDQIGSGSVDNWYPDDTALLFKHFQNGRPDINLIGFTDTFPVVSDEFGGSIVPYLCHKDIRLTNCIGTEGTFVFDYAQKGTSENYQRLLTFIWNLDGALNERINIYAPPNSAALVLESASQSAGNIPSKGTCIVTYNIDSLHIYITNGAPNQLTHITKDLVKNRNAVNYTASVGAAGNASVTYPFNGYLWNIAYIPRVITESERKKIFGK